MPYSKILSAGVALALCSPALLAAENDREPAAELDTVEVLGGGRMDPLLPDTMPSVDDGMVFSGKKTTAIDLEIQPTFVEPNLRQMFARLPGLFVSEQKIPSIYNVNYRGLGNPHESEFVAFFQDSVPLASDLFGYPTIYYLPPAQRVERVEFVRGGSGLLFGPQVGPTINFITRRADAEADAGGSTEHSFGTDGFYSTYNQAQWGDGTFGLMASYDRREADGPRLNEDYQVDAGYLGVAYAGIDDVRIGFDLDLYQSDSGEAGRLTSAEFAANRDLTKTPFNRVEIDRVIATLSYDQQLSADATLNGRAWYSYQDRFSRRSGAFIDPADEPATTNIDQQEFKTFGLDLRYARAWGADHVLTVGTTAYRTDSPRTRHVSPDIRSNTQRPEDLLYDQDRVITYNAVFVENLFRFGKLSLAPAARFERVNYDLFENVQQPSLSRDPIDVDETENEALFGLGAMYQVGEVSEIYANISEAYRPQRFDDLANPSAELAAENAPEVSRAMNYELGLRSSPVNGLVLDVSVFRIEVEDKVEQIQVNVSDVLRVNSGDSRHQGLEFSVEYDFFALRESQSRLLGFVNGSLLDAEITRSVNTSLVGNTPAFAPEYLVRTGLVYENDRWKVALIATLVDEQFWQDSNLPRGTGDAQIDAVIPSYQVVDLNGEYRVTDAWTLFGGINNLLDEDYYSRVRNDGIEPAAEQTFHAGFRFEF
ncbi:TonB-dependent receptor [Wenzhouxiangella sp. XN24]|uniref:TonB-dependent receptor family protein n=1 Tax=Wenzhouxiangella sp. XN24 TaxID=2713569 RepID=UPI0013EA9416|nr:TonB-dependent receptor [Wenzhouxiangella sp. XN24]NGX15578.1 TonB-dependent receptor [Wenzhouxiangella sp. XN24]